MLFWILSSLLLSGCNVMGDQASFNDEFFQTPYKYDKVYFRHGNNFDIGDVGIGYTYQYEVIVEMTLMKTSTYQK